MQTEILPPATLNGNIHLLGLHGSERSNTTSSLQPWLIECGVSQSRRLSHGIAVPKSMKPHRASLQTGTPQTAVFNYLDRCTHDALFIIHPSIFCCLSGAGSQWQQAKRGSPDVPLANIVFLLLLDDPEPDEINNLSSMFLVYPGVSSSSPLFTGSV